MDTKPKGILVIYESEEDREALKLLVQEYYDSKLDNKAQKRLIARKFELKEGVRRLIANLSSALNDPSLKS